MLVLNLCDGYMDISIRETKKKKPKVLQYSNGVHCLYESRTNGIWGSEFYEAPKYKTASANLTPHGTTVCCKWSHTRGNRLQNGCISKKWFGRWVINIIIHQHRYVCMILIIYLRMFIWVFIWFGGVLPTIFGNSHIIHIDHMLSCHVKCFCPPFVHGPAGPVGVVDGGFCRGKWPRRQNFKVWHEKKQRRNFRSQSLGMFTKRVELPK